jgi:hypothetical protein
MQDKGIPEHSGSASVEGSRHRSATENVRELTEASKQLLEAGKQMSDNLSELSNRVQHATDISSQVLRSPWFLAGAALAAGTLMLLIGRHD